MSAHAPSPSPSSTINVHTRVEDRPALLVGSGYAAVLIALVFVVGAGLIAYGAFSLEKLKETTDIDLDPERKAAMVSNLLVVLVSDKDATPVVNTGTLHA